MSAEGYDEAMAALGRPAPSAPPPTPRPRAQRIRLEDGPALFLAVLFGVLTGLAIGYEVVQIGAWVLLVPAVLTVACALALGRPLLQTLIAAMLSCGLAGIIGVPLLLLRLIGSIWS